ncbi:MAG: hypothetical protein IJC91_01290 [Oscillospiraceae bacterium]|nr:hypothetical protein [Oscillospiraceae bacterium]
MFADTAAQLQLILSCVVFGFTAGIVWDLLRAFRPKRAHFANTLLDVLSVTAFFVVLFLIGYTAGSGAQRIYAPLFSLCACALYFCGLSSVFLGIFRKAAALLRKFFGFIFFPVRYLLKTAKKFCKILKNFFYSSKICYTMKCRRKNVKDEGPTEKGTANETEKGKYYY